MSSWQTLLCQEKVNPPQELLSQNPEITGLTEIVDFKSVYCFEVREISELGLHAISLAASNSLISFLLFRA